MEGNRRVTACKLLLSPSLIPSNVRKQFPKLNTAAELARINKVPVDVSPDRRAAEHILTLRHTEPGIRKWKPVARMRRVMRLLDDGLTIEDIAGEYNATPSKVRKTIREYRLLRLAEELKGLTFAERDLLDNPDLNTNPYTRFFELDGVKEFLGLQFSPSGHPIIQPPRTKFDERVKRIARALLLGGKSSKFNTRSTPSDVLGVEFAKFLKRRGATQAQPRSKSKQSKEEKGESIENGSTPTVAMTQAEARRPDKFFENLVCRISDNNIACVVTEIKRINPELNPICGTYLLRTLVELSLRWLITSSGKSTPGRGDPTLSELVNFSLQNRDIFPMPRMGDVIEHAKAQKSFDYLNIVVHQKWMNADSMLLKSAASQLRNFIAHIVQGTP